MSIAVRRVAEVFVEVADTWLPTFDMIEFLHVVTGRIGELVEVAAVGLRGQGSEQ